MFVRELALHLACACRMVNVVPHLQKTPSQHITELIQPVKHADGWRPRPKILELLNMADFTHQVRVL